jgi:predicted Zn finger-like uncharacterized protein
VLTRCPVCETRFRVTTEQLKARSGRVRCGKCQHVFSALDSLIEEPVALPLIGEPAPQRIAAALAEEELEAAAGPEARPDEVAVSPAPTFRTETEATGQRPDPKELQSPIPRFPATEPSNQPEAEAIDPDTVAEVPDWSETFPEPPPPPRRWPWAIASFFALTAIGLQATLAFRVELAVLWPEAKPVLGALCDIAGCEVGLPAKVALVGIEASDLYPDTGHPGRLALTATLKSRAPFAQQFPHLELTLTDTVDKAIARKVLAPADYLPSRTIPASGMQPNADILVALNLDPGEMAASGYRLYLFYP